MRGMQTLEHRFCKSIGFRRYKKHMIDIFCQLKIIELYVNDLEGAYLAITSLVLGIVGILITLFSAGSLGIAGLLCGAAGIVFGVLGHKKQPHRRKIAVAGIILSLIAAGLGLVLFKACTAMAMKMDR